MKYVFSVWQKIWAFLFIIFLIAAFFKWDFLLNLKFFVSVYLVFVALFIYLFRK